MHYLSKLMKILWSLTPKLLSNYHKRQRRGRLVYFELLNRKLPADCKYNAHNYWWHPYLTAISILPLKISYPNIISKLAKRSQISLLQIWRSRNKNIVHTVVKIDSTCTSVRSFSTSLARTLTLLKAGLPSLIKWNKKNSVDEKSKKMKNKQKYCFLLVNCM